METILWQRLDVPGHDACRLIQNERGWRLEGATAFSHEGAPASLAYGVYCDHQWRTRQGTVRGWMGEHPVDVRITRLTQGIWKLNGQVVPDLDDCVDLDFGFTPATNLFQIRRIALEV
jgi:uncharacterized protein